VRVVSKTHSLLQFHCVAALVRRLRQKPIRLDVPPVGEAGFTLVEVIVALAILAGSLSILFEMISGGLLRTSSAEKMIEAGSLTQSLLAEIGTNYPVMTGERAGEFANGYHWRLKMQPIGDGKEEGAIGLYEISANVEWEEGSERRSFLLNILRVGPKASRR
jgi:general secretion pathway protein I